MLQRSKLLLLCNKILVLPFSCNFFTYEALLTRSKKLYLKNNRILGPLDDKNDELEEEFSTYDEDGEQNFEKYDFMKAHLAHDDYYRGKKILRKKIERKIIAKKFFSPGPQPSMLTYNERQCIKYLNKQDPVQWNVQNLAESFPATPDIIIKVLKSRWKPSPERIKIMDIKTQKNWELLKDGKLKANPKFIEHLKKFTNRKEILLEQIKNSNFYLPEIKKEKVWNNGEMNKILIHYENEVNKIHKRDTNKLLIESGSEIEKSLTKSTEKNVEIEEPLTTNFDKNEILHEQLNAQKHLMQDNLNLNRQESIIMEEMFSKFNEQMTLDNLKNNVKLKAEARLKLSKAEKKLFESSVDASNFSSNQESQNNRPSLSNSKNKNSSYKKYERKLPEQLIAKESSVLISDEAMDQDFLSNEEKIIDELSKQNNFQHFQEYKKNTGVLFTNLDDNTKVYTQTNVSELFEKTNKVETISKKMASRTKFKEFIERNPENLEKDKMIFDNNETDLKNTAFWNGNNTSEEKRMIEEKKALNQLKDIDKVTKADLCSTDSFPLKIKIPKSGQRSGLIFKIRDCYYDDDGEFLYRVPGMTK